jgi:putative ABC transport system permease protein
VRSSPRWTKMWRDVARSPARIGSMVLAIAAGVAAFAAMLAAYAILTRELPKNYQATLPASASLEVEGIDGVLLDAVRARPGIRAARGAARVFARVALRSGEWRPLTLYAADDFGRMEMNLVSREAGAWPPPRGAVVLEREALPLTPARLGEALSIKTADGVAHEIVVAGTAHDPGIPAPGQGTIVSGFVTLATAADLGAGDHPTTLMITVRDGAGDRDAIEREAVSLAAWLRASGHRVTAIRVPPPGEHPHQRIMTSMLALLLAFSAVAAALGALLGAAMTEMLLAEQRREIGILRAVGARTSQIAALYLALVLAIGVVATALGASLGVSAGRALARVALTQFMNFALTSDALPAWAILTLASAGTLLPLLAALPAIRRATRATVQSALADVAAESSPHGFAPIARALGRGTFSAPLLAVRSTLLRPRGLFLSLALLAASGATFLGSSNVRRGAQQHLADAAAERRYDIETFLGHPLPADVVVEILSRVPGIERAVPWRTATACPLRPDGEAIERSFPDGSHGTLTLAAVPSGGAPFSTALLSGRWLDPGDDDAIVLNDEALDFFPGAKVGDVLHWSARGELLDLRVLGIARQGMTSATGYVTSATFTKRVDPTGSSAAYRVVLRDHVPESVDRAATRIEQALEARHIVTRFNVTETMLRREVGGHFNLLLAALDFIAVLMAIVGMLGLFSTMVVRVLERRRELGVLRAVGATSRAVVGSILLEGTLVGALGGLAAAVLSIPLSSALGYVVGTVTTGVAFTALLSPWPAVLCLAATTAGAAVATLPAALRVAYEPLSSLLER